MAKGDVVLKFDAQTADYVQKQLAILRTQEAIADSARKMGDTVAQAGDKIGDAMSKGAGLAEGAAKSMLGPLANIASAAGVVSLALEGINKQMEITAERAEGLRNLDQVLAGALEKAGQMQHIGQVTAGIEQLAGRDFSGMKFGKQQITEQYAGIAGAMGSRANADATLAATEAALQAQRAGATPDAARQVGITFAEMARERKPGQTDAELQQLAYQVTTQLEGAPSERQLRAGARFPNQQKYFEELAKFHQEHADRDLAKLEEESLRPIDLRKEQHEARTPIARQELARHRRLAAIPPDDRISAMILDPSLAPPEMREELAKVHRAVVPQVNLAADQAAFAASAQGKVLIRQQNVTAVPAYKTPASEAEEIQAVRDEASKWAKREHPYTSWMTPGEFDVVAAENLARKELNAIDTAALDPSIGHKLGQFVPGVTQESYQHARRLAVLRKLHGAMGTGDVETDPIKALGATPGFKPTLAPPPPPPSNFGAAVPAGRYSTDAAGDAAYDQQLAAAHAQAAAMHAPQSTSAIVNAVERLIQSTHALHDRLHKTVSQSVPGLAPDPSRMPRNWSNSSLRNNNVGQK